MGCCCVCARGHGGGGGRLPGLQPGLADQMQLEQALGASEASDVEAQLLVAAQASSEMEDVQEAILQAALQASLADATGVSSIPPPSTGSAGSVGGEVNVAESALLAKPLGAGNVRGEGSVSGDAVDSGRVVGGGVGGGGGTAAGGSGAGAGGGGEAAHVSDAVQMLLAMGFSLPRAVAAHSLFGEDVDSMLEYLTSDDIEP